jgi:hypothetical protein
MSPTEHASRLAQLLERYCAERPTDENRRNLIAAQEWLRLIEAGATRSEIDRLLRALDALPNVGTITIDLQLACRHWLTSQRASAE